MMWLEQVRVVGLRRGPAGCRRLLRGVLAAFFVLSVVSSEAFAQTTQPASAPAAASQPAAPSANAQLPKLQLDLIGEGDAPTRRKAALDLLRIGTDEAIAVLCGVLDRKNDDRAKLAICQAVAEIGSQAIRFTEPLLALAEHPDAVLSGAAIKALSGYRAPEIAARVKQIKAEQERQQQRQAVIQLSLKVYDLTPDAAARVALLASWLQGQLVVQRETALDIVLQELTQTRPSENLVNQIRAMLDEDEPEVLRKAVRVLRDLRKPQDAPRLRTLLERKQPPEVREEVYIALGLLADPESIRVCATGLQDPRDRVAAQAAAAIGLLTGHNPGPTEELLAVAVKALLDRAAQPMAEAVLRESVIEAMASIGDARFLPIFTRHVGSAEAVPTIRQAAVRGIGQIGDRTQLPAILTTLEQDPDARVREAAAETLGRLGHQPDHLQLLGDRLGDTSEAVQKTAWAAYQAVFERLKLTDQEAAVAGWGQAQPQETPRQVELLTLLEKLLSDRDAAPADRARVAANLVDAHLRSSDPGHAITVAAAFKLEPVRDAVVARLLAFVRETGKTDTKTALAFLEKVADKITDQYGPTWAPKFVAARQGLTPTTQPTTSTAPAG